MKKIRVISRNPFIVILLLFNQLFFSCTQDNIVKDQIDYKIKASNTDFFKGVLFLEGPVASYFSDFRDLNFRNYINDEKEINKIIDFQNILIASIENSDSNYLNNFRTEVSSGDFYRVEKAINEAKIEIKNHTLKILGLTDSDYNNLQRLVAEKVYKNSKVNEKISKEDVLKIAKEINIEYSEKNVKAEGPVSVDLWVYIYGAVAIAAVVVVVAFFADSEDQIQSVNGYDFYQENFLSEVTVKLDEHK